MDKIATREGYGNGLEHYGRDERIVALDADLSGSTKSAKFAKKYPERFFNMGVAEQDLVGTAAGLAASGKIPFASSFAVFVTGRTYDQVRVSVAYPRLNVKLVGSHAGLMTGEDGATHQALEDVALMRALPNMTVIQPCDAVETEKAVEAMIKHNGPVYLRTSRAKVPVISKKSDEFVIGKCVTLRDGTDMTIIASGTMVHEALQAAESLEKKDIRVRVLNMHTIKPIDEEAIITASKETGAILTCEDHSIIGGLGSAVAEVVVRHTLCVMEMIGVKDTFGESGKPAELYKKYGLDAESIVSASMKLLRRKKNG